MLTHKGQKKPYLDAPIEGVVKPEPMWLYGAMRNVVNPSPNYASVYDDGVWNARPGEPGPSVVAGHISHDGNPGTFYGLQNANVGDTAVFHYGTDDRVVAIVQKVVPTEKLDLPVTEIWSDTPERRVWMITCDPNSEASAEGYKGNVIVLAKVTQVIRAN